MEASARPGFIASGAAHAALLLAMLISFSHNPSFTDVQETIPVDLVTDSAVNQIMKGDKSAKKVQAHPHVDKVAKDQELKPKPPIGEAKRDVPTPPPPLKRIADPGDADKAAPPKPPAQAAAPPKPAPPLPPREHIPPPDKTADAPLPPPRPKLAHKKPPPKVAAKKPPQFKLDQIAKLLNDDKPLKPTKSHEHHKAKPKSGDDTHEDRKFSADDIARLLSREAAQRRASTGEKLQQLASLGAPRASAPRMSPSFEAAMEGWFQDKFQGCWNQPISLPQGPKYVPEIRVPLNLDGSLAAEPTLLNPPSDPAWQPMADSAMRAVRECDPLPVPDRFKPYFAQWRNRIVRFDAEEM